jgi:hypothetical protein
MNKVGYHVPEDHPAAFAVTHTGYEALRWRVPVDDTCSMHFTLYFALFVDGKAAEIPKDQSEEGLAIVSRENTVGTPKPVGSPAAIRPLRAGKPGPVLDRNDYLGSPMKG